MDVQTVRSEHHTNSELGWNQFGLGSAAKAGGSGARRPELRGNGGCRHRTRSRLQPRRGEGQPEADPGQFLGELRSVEIQASKFDLASLHQRLRLLLCAAYPQKKPEDFTVQPRTLGIVFRVSGMEVDLVPIIPIEGPGDYGWQPSSTGDAPIKTSVGKQLEFIRARKDRYHQFTALVRLVKHWRNHHELDETLRSFMIELIVSHLQDDEGSPPSLEKGLLRFFLYVAQSELRDPVIFPENGKVTSLPKDPVVILDPVNTENNVARRLTDLERQEIVNKATAAWETLTAARNNNFKGETLEYWKETFGRSFVIEEEGK